MPRADIEYAVDSLTFAGDIGDYNNGAEVGADSTQLARKSGCGATGIAATTVLALLATARLSNTIVNDNS